MGDAPGTRRDALLPHLRAVVVAALLAVSGLVSGCGGTAEAQPDASTIPLPAMTAMASRGEGPFAPSSQDPAPCDSAFIADMISDFRGQPTAEEALAVWVAGDESDPVIVPAGVPHDGWQHDGPEGDREQRFTSAAWQATALQSSRGEWLVARLGCVTWTDAAETS